MPSSLTTTLIALAFLCLSAGSATAALIVGGIALAWEIMMAWVASDAA